MTPTDRMLSKLQKIHTGLAADGIESLNEFRTQAAQALYERFACSLATLWCVEGEPGRQRLVCVTSLSDRPDESLTGLVLEARDIGAYFTDLLRDGIFNSPDALNDPRLLGLRERYLVPNQVGALLDATARSNGQPIGVICIEQRGRTRHWTRADETDLRRATAQICLSLNRLKAMIGLSIS